MRGRSAWWREGSSLFVARARGRWALTNPWRPGTMDADDELIIDLLRASGGRRTRLPVEVKEMVEPMVLTTVDRRRHDHPPVSNDTIGVVAPVPLFVGAISGGSLHVNGKAFDVGDVRALHLVDRTLTLPDLEAVALGEAAEVAQTLRDRVARLVAAGCLLGHAGEPADAIEASSAPTTPRRGGRRRGRRSPATLRRGPTRPSAAAATSQIRYLEDPAPPDAGHERIPVFAVWQAATGPALSLGMLTAAARHHDGGRLTRHFAIRRPEDPGSFFGALEHHDGPGVLLLTDYVWSLEANLALAHRAKARCPELLVVHGGPSSPKFAADAERFFSDHGPAVDVAVRGEGEATLVELLGALADAGGGPPDLSGVAGLTYRDHRTGAIVRTADRERSTELDLLPSPYLSGEFDHLDATAWTPEGGVLGLVIETNRGCPYGCTFCDWGSSTLSRIRKFSLERVEAEMRWAASHGHHGWVIADANFGIVARDVEIARRLASVKADLGAPSTLGFNVAKNTTRHLVEILNVLVDAGVDPHFTLALQTRDPDTLTAVDRTNISSEHYLALAAELRVRGIPAPADLMLGLPGQTPSSFAEDLQFLVDHEMPARVWLTQLLPNSPMNDPVRRAEQAVEADEDRVVRATRSFDRADRTEMMRLRHAYATFEQHGLLRHVLRFLQWDHGLAAVEVLQRLLVVTAARPREYPLLTWLATHFDRLTAIPVGPDALAMEARRFVVEELAVEDRSALDTVFAVQRALVPSPSRTYPATISLDHDYVEYYREHTCHLWGRRASAPIRPLALHAPGELVIHGDPLDVACSRIRPNHDPGQESMIGEFWVEGHWELDSDLTANFASVAGSGRFRGLADQRAWYRAQAPAPGDRSPLSVRSPRSTRG